MVGSVSVSPYEPRLVEEEAIRGWGTRSVGEELGGEEVGEAGWDVKLKKNS